MGAGALTVVLAVLATAGAGELQQAPPATLPLHQGTLPPHALRLPRPDSLCAGLVTVDAAERRPENTAANQTVPAGPVAWSQSPDQTHWRRWIRRRKAVTGNFRGTTDQIFTWAACKWGIDEDLLRAVAAWESEWRQSEVGDEGASFGIMQVKDHEPDGSPDWGGFPDTLTSTALNVDFYAAYLRACYDGAFYDGGEWLYGGPHLSTLIARRGERYALWGCVGSWFSGDWYDPHARGYIRSVKQTLRRRVWLGYPALR